MNSQDEKMNFAIAESKHLGQLLQIQNANIKLKLDEEKNKGMMLKKQLLLRRPFKKTNTGEIIFPGKKEMESKMDIMAKDILKLKSVLGGFERNRCQTEKTRKLFKTICDLKTDHVKDDNTDLKQNRQKELEETNEKYKIMVNEFDQAVLEVSKYRVQLDKLKKEQRLSELEFEKDQLEFNDVRSQLEKTSIISDEDYAAQQKKFEIAKNRLDDLKSIMAYQMDEIKDKNKSYMNSLHTKDYQMIRANALNKEKAKITAEFETGFDQMKKYFESRLEGIGNLPAALLAIQEKLVIQKERKTSMAESIMILQEQLKTLMDDNDIGGDSDSVLTEIKAKNDKLASELEKKEKILADIHHAKEKIKQAKIQEESRLAQIKSETAFKINKTRVFLNGLTKEYLKTIDQLQNEVSKTEALSCFENNKQNAMNSTMQNQIDSLSNIFQSAKEKITEMKIAQNTQPDVCKL